MMPNRFINIFSNDSSAPPSKSAIAGEVDGTTYGLNEWATVSKTKKYFNNYLVSIILVTYIKTITPNRFTEIN